jgi:hypothetical protein
MTAQRVPSLDSLVQGVDLGVARKAYLGLKYYEPPPVLLDAVFAALPRDLRGHASVDVCVITGESNVPHIDHDCCSKINIYLQTGDARTIFFDTPKREGFVFPGTNKPNVFGVREHRLRSISEFSANAGEAWLLDVSKIHCVAMDPSRTRKMVSISFELTYAEVASSLALM